MKRTQEDIKQLEKRKEKEMEENREGKRVKNINVGHEGERAKTIMDIVREKEGGK